MRIKIVGIYKIVCKSNGSLYIGSSSDIKTRWSAHRSKFRKLTHNPKINACVKKYGVESFEFSIIEECSIESLIERETYWADYYKKNNCVLLNCGDFIDSPTRGTKLSEERIMKIREFLKGNTHTKGFKCSDERKKEMSRILVSLGRKMSKKNNDILDFYRRKKKSQISKDRMSKARIDFCGVKVICLNTGEKYDCLTEASNKINTSYQNLRQSINRGGRCKGFNFAYVDDNLSSEEIDILLNTDLRKNKKTRPNNKNICRELYGKKIYCEELGLTFQSISEASEYFKVSPTTIRNYLSLNKKLKNNYSLKSLC